MRADRLVATLLVLQAKGRVTAAELADELEVSVKTARRDLEALAIAGIPVYSQAGKGGGWQLLGGARTDLSGLTAAEARTLFMVAGPSSTATPEAKAALRKLVQALPETFRADAEAAASAVVLDPAGWGGTTVPRPAAPRRAAARRRRRRPGAPRLRRPHAQRDASASSTRSGSSRRTASGTSSPTPPTGCARSASTGSARVEPTGEPVVRPAGFDLAATWDAVVATIEEKRTSARAVVRMPAWGQYGAARAVRPEHDGRRRAPRRARRHRGRGARPRASSPSTWPAGAIGRGRRARAEVRDGSRAIGRQLVERYDGDRGGSSRA